MAISPEREGEVTGMRTNTTFGFRDVAVTRDLVRNHCGRIGISAARLERVKV